MSTTPSISHFPKTHRIDLYAFGGCGHTTRGLPKAMQYRSATAQGHPVMSQTPIFTLNRAQAPQAGGFHL